MSLFNKLKKGVNDLASFTAGAAKAAVALGTAPITIPLQVVSDPKAAAASIAGVGQLARQATAPWLELLNDARKALAPRFDLGLDLDVDADVGLAGTIQHDVRFSVPFHSPVPSDRQPQVGLVGDITGGFLAGLSADYEGLRQARRTLSLLSHLARNGHRVGQNDSIYVHARFTPDDVNSFLKGSELPRFIVEISEWGSSNTSHSLLLEMPRESWDTYRRERELLESQLTTSAPENSRDKLLTSTVNRQRITFFKRICLNKPSGGVENPIDIAVRLAGMDKVPSGMSGQIHLSVCRESAYVRDDVFTAQLYVRAEQPFSRELRYVLLLGGYGKPKDDGGFLHGDNGKAASVTKCLKAAIGAAQLRWSMDNEDAQKGLLSGALRLAAAKYQVLQSIDELTETLRDIFVDEDIDVRARTIVVVRGAGGKVDGKDVVVELFDEVSRRVFSASQLMDRDCYCCVVPAAIGKAEIRANCSCIAASQLPDGSAPLVEFELQNGWLGSVETIAAQCDRGDAVQQEGKFVYKPKATFILRVNNILAR